MAMPESRVGRLLLAYGVKTRWTVREAAKQCGVSHETLYRLLQPLEPGEMRRIRRRNLDKIADGLGIPRDLLKREMMADWGFDIEVVGGSTVAEILAQIQDLSAHDLATIQVEVGRMQQARAREGTPAAARPSDVSPAAAGDT